MNIAMLDSLLKRAGRVCLCFLLANGAFAAGTAAVDRASGQLVFTGSVALSNLMTYWTEAFSMRHPLITVTIADPGGNAGIAALINGTADMALIDGPIGSKQREAFERRYGYAPRVIPVAMDAVAVYVNDANPLTRVTLLELDAIFSATYHCGERRPIRVWGELGAEGGLAKRPIRAYGLTGNTGTASLFREIALCGGDYSRHVQALAGPEAVLSTLNSDVAGIGFASSSMRSSRTRPLAVASDKHGSGVAPTPEAIRSRKYPMSRTLSIAVNEPPNRRIPPALRVFERFVLSEEGQNIAAKAGYVALP